MASVEEIKRIIVLHSLRNAHETLRLIPQDALDTDSVAFIYHAKENIYKALEIETAKEKE